jgi:hypothetical protein
MSQYLKIVPLCAAAIVATTDPVISHADDTSMTQYDLQHDACPGKRQFHRPRH